MEVWEFTWLSSASVVSETILSLFLLPHPHRLPSSIYVQATERMKIVDVLGAKQFPDGERIIVQVRPLIYSV